MATVEPLVADTFTLTGTTADVVEFQQWWKGVAIFNHEAAGGEILWVCFNPGVTATAGGPDSTPIPPQQSLPFYPRLVGPEQTFTVVGDGNEYSVEGLNTQ